MSIERCACPKCQKVYPVPENIIGKKSHCIQCGAPFVVRKIGGKTILALAGVSGDAATVALTEKPEISKPTAAAPKAKKIAQKADAPAKRDLAVWIVFVGGPLAIVLIVGAACAVGIWLYRSSLRATQDVVSATQKTSTPAQPTEKEQSKERLPEKKEEPKPAPQKTDWSKVGNVYEQDGIRITLCYAIETQLSIQRGTEFAYDKATYIKVRVENTSKTKLLRWKGWNGRSEAEDENGNRYDRHRMGGWKFSAQPVGENGQVDPEIKAGRLGDDDCLINPGEKVASYIWIEPVIPSSSEIRLTLPKDAFDATSGEVVRFKILVKHVRASF